MKQLSFFDNECLYWRLNKDGDKYFHDECGYWYYFSGYRPLKVCPKCGAVLISFYRER